MPTGSSAVACSPTRSPTAPTGRSGFLTTHDELFWNVTGNFWDFPIQNARAEFVLPGGARAEQVVTYTGRLGSRDNNASASIGNGGNVVTAQTTATLARREGLSVAIWMPPGSVTRPDQRSQEMAWYIRDNLAALISFASFAAHRAGTTTGRGTAWAAIRKAAPSCRAGMRRRAYLARPRPLHPPQGFARQ
jgi:hypothetical protein